MFGRTYCIPIIHDNSATTGWPCLIESTMFLCSLSSRQLFAQQSCPILPPVSDAASSNSVPKNVHVFMLSWTLTQFFWCQEHVIRRRMPKNHCFFLYTSTISTVTYINSKGHGDSPLHAVQPQLTSIDYFCRLPPPRLQHAGLLYFSSLHKMHWVVKPCIT